MTRRLTSAFRQARRLAKQASLEQRARLIDAGIVLTEHRNKFNRVKTTYRGQTYDSMGEAEFAHKLDVLLANGDIVSWSRPQPVVVLNAPTARERIYKPDFLVTTTTGFYYLDYKGSHATETPAWRLKVKLWKTFVDAELRVAYPTGEEKVVAPGKVT